MSLERKVSTDIILAPLSLGKDIVRQPARLGTALVRSTVIKVMADRDSRSDNLPSTIQTTPGAQEVRTNRHHDTNLHRHVINEAKRASKTRKNI